MRWRKRSVPEIRFLALNASGAEAREFRVLKPEVSIGSTEDNQFVIRRASVSRRHATLAYRKDHFELSDPGSTNGTFVNGRRVTNPATVELGDEVRFGDAIFALGKPLGPGAPPRSARKRNFMRRGMLEAIVLTFAVGFAAAQYLAYLYYHEQNRLILAEAVPVPIAHTANAASPSPASAVPVAKSTPPQAPSEARPVTTPVAVARPAPRERRTINAAPPKVPKHKPAASGVLEIPKLNAAVAVADKELAGGIALARLIVKSGTEAGQPAPGLSLRDLWN